MEIRKTVSLSILQKESVLAIWNAEYPVQLQFSSLTEFENYLRALANPIHYLAINREEKIAAWAFVFVRENERWFAIIVDRDFQKKGLGTALLQILKADEETLNGWMTDHNNYTKSDRTIYFSPSEFYKKNNFILLENTRLKTEKLSAVKIKWTR